MKNIKTCVVTTVVVTMMAMIAGVSGQEEFLNRLRYRVIREMPHDTNAFTQGLECVAGTNCEEMLESTGGYGTSTMRRVKTATGEVEESIGLEGRYFGEGVTALGKRIYQLTWKEGEVILYERANPMKRIGLKKWECSEEAWGLTNNGTHLIASDGTPKLRWIDPKTMTVVAEKTIHWKDGRPTWQMNEIEFVKGKTGPTVWANLFTSTEIVRIDIPTALVTGVVDLQELVASNSRGNTENVLNGVAFNEASGTFFVTGKRWGKMFEIEVIHRLGSARVEL